MRKIAKEPKDFHTQLEPRGKFLDRLIKASRVGYPKLMKVYDMECGICYLCGFKIPDPRLDYELHSLTIHNSPSLDHVKPRSAGGGKAYENLRLSHKRCNSLRGIKEVTD